MTGLLLVVVGLAAAGYLGWLLFGGHATLPAHRRRPGVEKNASATARMSEWLTGQMSKLIHGREAALVEQLSQASLSQVRPVDYLVWVLIITVVASSIGALLGGIIGVFVGGLGAFGVIQGVIAFLAGRRRKAFDSQMLETLQIVSGSLRAGQGLSVAIGMVADESESPTREEFSRAVNEMRIGADMEVALQAVADRTRSDSMQWMVHTVSINQAVGGSLADAIEGATETIRSRIELAGQVKTLAAEGKLSAIILVALPFFVCLVVSLLTPGFLNPLFQYTVGWVILAGCSVSMAIGVVWMRSLIRIDY